MAVLVSDSFNRANNTTLGSTDNYNGGTAKVWQYSNTPFGIDANQAYLTSGTNGIAYVDAGVSDCDVTVTLSTAHTYTYSCVSVRVQDASNQISLQYDGSTWYLYKQVSGAFTQLASASFAATDGDIIKVRLNGTSISVFMNGSTTPLMSGTTASFQTVTNHGLQPANTNNRYDNFQIESLSTGGTDATITAIASTATNSAVTPTVTAQRNVSITSVVATSTMSGVAPSVSTSANVTSIAANASASANAPVIGQVTIVGAVVATASAQSLAPSVTAQQQAVIVSTAASCTALALAPKDISLWHTVPHISTTWIGESTPSTNWT